MSRVAIAAFSGWNDAGDAATGALEHLAAQGEVRRLATIPAEEFTDFQVNRPEIAVDEDHLVRILWPETTIDLLLLPRGPEIVLVQGPEPSLRWQSFTREVLDALDRADVTSLVTLGALLADVPHSRPLPTTHRVEPGIHEPVGEPRYEGPVGIPTIIARQAVARGLRTISIWVQVPHYVAHGPSPKGTLALIREIESALPITVDTESLEEESEAWARGVDELARTDEEIAEYVARLERAQDAADVPEASGDAIAREFERFLKRRRED